jgi:hypothetical protein
VRKYLLLLLFIFPLQGEEKETLSPLFTPPKEWHKNPSSLPSSKVKVSYFIKAKKEFCPSINLIEEKVSSSMEKYLKSIQKMYESDSENRFRRLGTLKTKAGTAHLTSLDMTTAQGKVRILQSLFLQEGVVYILTGAVLQEDFGRYQKDITDSFRSFSLVPHLEDYVKDETQKSILLTQIESLTSNTTKNTKQWEPFKNFIIQQFKEEGPYWQLLILEKMQKKLSESQN